MVFDGKLHDGFWPIPRRIPGSSSGPLSSFLLAIWIAGGHIAHFFRIILPRNSRFSTHFNHIVR